MKKVLVVDDDIGICETTADILAAKGHRVVVAQNGYEAIEQVKQSAFDLVLMDMVMPGIDGLETYKEMRNINPRVRVLMMTGHAIETIIEEALEEGVKDVLPKPLEMAKVMQSIEAE